MVSSELGTNFNERKEDWLTTHILSEHGYRKPCGNIVVCRVNQM